ncbi:MAG: hypothetical protein HYZ48_01255 [Chlamydiales bacterium]|nr:hypothetical protein [Chlamydiales bacterium]
MKTFNKCTHPLDTKLSKKIKKEVRKSQKEYAVPSSNAYEDALTEKEMSKKFPRKGLEKKADLLEKIKKGIQRKKVKSKKNLSKRTTPGAPLSDSAPAFTHKEGVRWIKTLTTQNKMKRKGMQKRMTKKGNS